MVGQFGSFAATALAVGRAVFQGSRLCAAQCI
jgi:hypothetical protein